MKLYYIGIKLYIETIIEIVIHGEKRQSLILLKRLFMRLVTIKSP